MDYIKTRFFSHTSMEKKKSQRDFLHELTQLELDYNGQVVYFEIKVRNKHLKY